MANASTRSRREIISDIRTMLGREFPGVITEVDQPLAHLLSHMLSGVKAQVAIKVFGPDLDVLRRVARDVEDAVRPIPGVVDLYTEPQVLVDQVVVTPRREHLARFGLNVSDLAEVVAAVERVLEPIRAELADTPGYSIRIGGQFEARREATRLITLFSILSAVIMFFVLYVHFRSVNLSLQVFASVPMAFIGAVALIVITGQPVSVATLGGLISSTLLDFLVRPALFWTFGRKTAEQLVAAPRRKDRATEEMEEEFEAPGVTT